MLASRRPENNHAPLSVSNVGDVDHAYGDMWSYTLLAEDLIYIESAESIWSGSSLATTPDGSTDPNEFFVCELIDPVAAQFASESGAFDATEG